MPEGRGLAGHLELAADRDARGETRLCRQAFRAPFHLSKGHRDAGALVLNVANPTPGLLDGDRLQTAVRVARGARLVLTTPGASRVHAMRGGRAELAQRFWVEAGGSLEVWPELLIPQRGARYWQRTGLDLEAGAELLFFEALAPGRTAMGEAFAFEEVRLATDLRLGGQLIARERYRLSPGDGSLAALRRRFPTAYCATAFLVADGLAPRAPAWNALLALHGDAVWLGLGALAEDALILKIVAADALIFRRVLRAARQAAYEALGRPPPDLRRAGEPA